MIAAALDRASPVAARDPLGSTSVYYCDDGRFGPRVRPLLKTNVLAHALDPSGVAFAWGLAGDASRSCFAGIRRLAPGQLLCGDGRIVERSCGLASHSLIDALLAETERILRSPVALWLSGGLDSALLLALAVSLGKTPRTYVLRPLLDGTSGYDESDAAVATARALGVEVEIIDATQDDFIAALPAAVAAAETPFWNLHPVSKRLLADRARADGFSAVLTGDGADEAFASAPTDDYLPLVAAITASCGIALRSPFFAETEVAAARATDVGKQALRDLARAFLPASICDAPKRARLAPTIGLSAGNVARLNQLAALQPAPLPSSDLRMVTLDLLCGHFELL